MIDLVMPYLPLTSPLCLTPVLQADTNAFKRFSLSFLVPMPWSNAQDEDNMLAKLRSGEVSAAHAG